jgi:hypothetical protein
MRQSGSFSKTTRKDSESFVNAPNQFADVRRRHGRADHAEGALRGACPSIAAALAL